MKEELVLKLIRNGHFFLCKERCIHQKVSRISGIKKRLHDISIVAFSVYDYFRTGFVAGKSWHQ